jgi:hypothetical protein
MKKFYLLFPVLFAVAVFLAFETDSSRLVGQTTTIPDSVMAMSRTDTCLKIGKLVFVDNKCTNCHTVKSANLTEKKGSANAPDLSNVGSTLNAVDIMQFITKDKEINGKKHPIAFKGEKMDLYALSLWLESLKTP